MCDTLVALPNSTAGRATFFAKNSDRLFDEAQQVERHPRQQYEAGAYVDCTYIAIPQVRETQPITICRPWWMWGAEMGINGCGVAIGNEAVFARTPPHSEPALLGMDLVRLGLERSSTAAESVEIIIELLETHGQGGNCARPGPQYYDNSFIIADADRAYVLETIGRRWLIEEVRDTRAISNLYTIATPPARTSIDLDDWLKREGWAAEGVINHSKCLGDESRLASGEARYKRAGSMLHGHDGGIELPDIFTILRDHGPDLESDLAWQPKPGWGRICSHADAAEPRGQTVNALVCELRGNQSTMWVTGTPATCLSIFKPLFQDVDFPSQLSAIGADCKHSYWWEHDRLQRSLSSLASCDFASIRHERDLLEKSFRKAVNLMWVDQGDRSARQQLVDACWSKAAEFEASLSQKVANGQL